MLCYNEKDESTRGGIAMIPLSIPNFEGNEKKYVTKAVAEGWVSTGGAYITELEKNMAEYLKVPEVAACQSGTAGLHLSMVECGVEPGDHVIVPTLTFIAAVNPVRYQFAEPIFMDCDDSLCMDPNKLKSFLKIECENTSKGTIYKATGNVIKALVAVHVFGNLADMESIMEIAQNFNIRVVEDATEAIGSYFETGKYAGKMAGTIGDFGVYSFNGNKIITTGGGGAVTGSDPKEVDHIRFLSTQAKTDAHNYIHDEIGYNYRMTNVQAAIGVAQLEYLEEFIKRKNANYDKYSELLSGLKTAKLIPYREKTRSNKWLYALDVDMKANDTDVLSLIEKCGQEGFQTRPIWGLIHLQKPYKKSAHYSIEKAVYYSQRVINIPCSTQITEDEIKFVADKLRTILK